MNTWSVAKTAGKWMATKLPSYVFLALLGIGGFFLWPDD